MNALRFDAGYQLILGANYRDERGDSTGVLDFGVIALPTDFSLDRSTASLFLDGHALVGFPAPARVARLSFPLSYW
ncbi:MAG: hypothetical protein O7F73_08480 [Gammaproteobacteria bacterium]|nr:hypothetical protein [Gammaproteobacteria bacterium]